MIWPEIFCQTVGDLSKPREFKSEVQRPTVF